MVALVFTPLLHFTIWELFLSVSPCRPINILRFPVKLRGWTRQGKREVSNSPTSLLMFAAKYGLAYLRHRCRPKKSLHCHWLTHTRSCRRQSYVPKVPQFLCGSQSNPPSLEFLNSGSLLRTLDRKIASCPALAGFLPDCFWQLAWQLFVFFPPIACKSAGASCFPAIKVPQAKNILS